MFPYFKNVPSAKGYPVEQMGLVIMDTFKGVDNEKIIKLCRENNSALIIVPHNLTNKFQPLDIRANKPTKVLSKRNVICGMLDGSQTNLTKAKVQQT